jgi:hypothetical protein
MYAWVRTVSCRADVNDVPLFTSSTTAPYSENLPIGTPIYNCTYHDDDIKDTSRFPSQPPPPSRPLPACSCSATPFLSFASWPYTLSASVLHPPLVPLLTPPPLLIVTFAIVGGNDNLGSPAFRINASTGVVYTASLHDYEGTPRSYPVNISITDDSTALYGVRGNLTTYTIVNFVLQDANDAPQLNATPYFHTRENLPFGTVVYNVVTFDQDVGDTGAWHGSAW